MIASHNAVLTEIGITSILGIHVPLVIEDTVDRAENMDQKLVDDLQVKVLDHAGEESKN